MRIVIIKNRRQKDDHELHQQDEHMRGNFEQENESDDKKQNTTRWKDNQEEHNNQKHKTRRWPEGSQW